MARIITPERQELKAEAIRLRKAGWAQQAVADALMLPRRTIRDWFDTAHSEANHTRRKSNLAITTNLVKGGNGSSITLFICRYEEVGDGIALASVDLILTDPPYQASSNNLSRTLQKTDLRRYKCRVCGRPFKDYYLPEEKRVCPRCTVEEPPIFYLPGSRSVMAHPSYHLTH